jgi:YcaO-like protein with predicted kinase domain
MLDWADTGKKSPVAGSNRTRSAAETLSHVLPMASRFGITRVANVTGLDRIGLPVVLATRPNSRSVAVSQGKGLTLEAAKASAVMEAIELWHAENIIQPTFFASCRDISHFGKSIETAQLPKVATGRFSETRRFHWIQGFDITSGEAVLVPLELVHTNYTRPGYPGEGSFPASTNGLASGNHPLEAVCHGICEVVERDALSIWHHRPEGARRKTGLDLASIDSDVCNGVIDAIRKANLHVAVWDVTSDTGIATFLCLIGDPEDAASHIGLGSGTHPDRETALARALTEAAQTRMNYITGSRDDLRHDEFTVAGRERMLQSAKAMWRWQSDMRSYSDVASCINDTLRKDCDWLLDRLRAVGIEQLACVDLSRPETGVFVMRVVIPVLEAPHDDVSYVPGERAMAAVKKQP